MTTRKAHKKFAVFIKGWTAKLQPASHPAAAFQFDVFVSAGGGRFVPDGETITCILHPFLSQKEGHRDVARAKMSTHSDDQPNFLWQPCSPRLLSSVHIPLFSFLSPLCQDSSTRRWGASWLSALRPTLSTGTRLLRPRSLRSVAWHESTTRSSSNNCSLIPVGIHTREEQDYETISLYSHYSTPEILDS